MEYIIGNTYKITGGKHKKHGKGVLIKFNKTYSSLKVEIGVLGSIGTGEGLAAVTEDIKVKNCYLHPVNEGVIEMPEADELQEVQGNPDDFVVMENLAPDEQEQAEQQEEEAEDGGELIDGIMMYEMKTDTTSGLAPNLDIVIDEVKEDKPKCQYSAKDGTCDCDVVMLRKKAEHFEQEFHCALAERDQADDKMTEQDQEIHNLTKRNEYLEEIVRKLLLP
tara:strand:+ start:2101 stop:2763 length:663 start_codon:yes stop_codon:yes gene_type:complete